jgi:DNA polymerase III epsilon subunit family exonuclease
LGASGASIASAKGVSCASGGGIQAGAPANSADAPQGPVRRKASSFGAGAGAYLFPGWEEASFLALDFETTGLDPRKERVVEIGAIRFSAKGEHGSLASLVRPGISIPMDVIAIHGISDSDVAHSPGFAEICGLLMALADGACIVAHNAPFDVAFLKAELERAGLPAPRNQVLDTRMLAKAAFPGLPSYRLVDLAARFRIDTGRSHRALDDAKTCMGLMLLCADRLKAHV